MKFIGSTLYFVDSGNHTLRSITSSEIINTIAGNGTAGFSGDGGPATQALLNGPRQLVVSPAGELYVADTVNSRIRKINPAGIISTIAGTGTPGFSGDNGLAINAQINFPRGMILRDDGAMYFTDYANNRIRLITPDGIISTFAGNGLTPQANGGIDGDFGAAVSASFNNVEGIALYLDGSLIVTDSGDNLIRKISVTPYPLSSNGTFSIPSEDSTEIYVFAQSGQHQQTLNAQTGAPKWTFGYDSLGNLISAADGDGNTTSINRDSLGNAVSITAPFGQVTSLTSDGNGNLASVTNPNGETYQMQYGSGSMLSQFSKPSGASSTMTYDALGNLTQDKNAAGGFTALASSIELSVLLSNTGGVSEVGNSLTTTTQTASGRPTKFQHITSTANIDEVNQIDGGGLITSTTVQAPRTVIQTPFTEIFTSYSQIDPRLGTPATYINNWQQQEGRGGAVNVVTRKKFTTASTTSDPYQFTTQDLITQNGKTTATVYTGTNHTFRSTSPQGRISTNSIDPQGRPLTVSQGNLTPVQFTYDSHGRLISTQQGSRTSSMTYDSQNNLNSATNSLGQTTSFTHDLTGRVTGTQLPDGRVIGYQFDRNGNLTSVTPPGRPSHNFMFSLIDLATSYVAPDIGIGNTTTQYAYNSDKQLTLVTRPDGQTIQYSYDTLTPRLLQIATPQGNYSYSYNSVGHLGSLTSPDGVTTSFGYFGSLPASISSTGPVQTSVAYQYTPDLDLASESINGNSINFGYDLDRLLISAGPLNIQRDQQNGLAIGSSLGTLQDSFEYDSFGAVLGYQLGSAYTLGLTRDIAGRVTTKSESVSGVNSGATYSYDSAGRLIQAAQSGGYNNTYQYDANSNRIAASIRGQSITATYDNQDRLLTYGQNSYTYNANGDLTSKTNLTGTTAYVYDVFGNLKSATLPDGTLITYIVDGSNRRVGKKVNGTLVSQFSYDLFSRVNAAYDGSGNLIERFIYLTKSNVPDAMIRADGSYRIISDHIGSVRMVVNASNGQIAQQIDYDEFGQVLNDTNPGFQPFGFAGGNYESQTKLVRFGARDYDAETGRWTNKDPIGFAGGSTGLYAYCGNDPVNCTDPSGLWTLQVGISFSGNIGPFSVNVNIGVAVDTSGNIGFYQTAGGGLGGGAGVLGGLSATVTNADTIGQLAGPFSNVTATAGAGLGGSIDLINGSSDGQNITGVGFTVGPAIGAGVSGGITGTTIQQAPHSCP